MEKVQDSTNNRVRPRTHYVTNTEYHRVSNTNYVIYIYGDPTMQWLGMQSLSWGTPSSEQMGKNNIYPISYTVAINSTRHRRGAREGARSKDVQQ